MNFFDVYNSYIKNNQALLETYQTLPIEKNETGINKDFDNEQFKKLIKYFTTDDEKKNFPFMNYVIKYNQNVSEEFRYHFCFIINSYKFLTNKSKYDKLCQTFKENNLPFIWHRDFDNFKGVTFLTGNIIRKGKDNFGEIKNTKNETVTIHSSEPIGILDGNEIFLCSDGTRGDLKMPKINGKINPEITYKVHEIKDEKFHNVFGTGEIEVGFYHKIYLTDNTKNIYVPEADYEMLKIDYDILEKNPYLPYGLFSNNFFYAKRILFEFIKLRFPNYKDYIVDMTNPFTNPWEDLYDLINQCCENFLGKEGLLKSLKYKGKNLTQTQEKGQEPIFTKTDLEKILPYQKMKSEEQFKSLFIKAVLTIQISNCANYAWEEILKQKKGVDELNRMLWIFAHKKAELSKENPDVKNKAIFQASAQKYLETSTKSLVDLVSNTLKGVEK